MYKVLKKIDKLEFLVLYMALLFFSGYWFVEYATTPAYFIIGGLLMLIGNVFVVQRKQVIICLIMIFSVMVAELLSVLIYGVQGFSIKLFVVSIISILISFMFANGMDRQKFKKNYIGCMIIIAIWSLVTWLITIFEPKILSILPTLVNSKGRVAYFSVFSIVSDFSFTGVQRNQGIFWEPGAFQFFLTLAYILEFSNQNKKPRKWVLALLVLTMVSTYSTTAIVVAVCLIVYTLSSVKGHVSIIKSFVIIAIAIAVISIIIPRLTGFWEYTLVKKVELVMNYQVGHANEASSRMDSIYYPLMEFFKSPLFGIGTAGYSALSNKAGHSMFTCTPINLIVKYGLLYGVVVMIGIWKYFKNQTNSNFDTWIIFLIFMLSTMTEALNGNIIVLALGFYGYMIPNKCTSLKNIRNLKREVY